ncbi:HK97 family phage prohead protease [Flavitalea sp.]|nr:HK97 family phage prohead protease [Flavitalea sp.]
MSYEIKNNSCKTLDVDDKSRRVKVALNRVGVMDFDKDIIEKTAFDKTITERGPKGADLIWHLTDHRASLKDAVGKFHELGIEGDYLYGVTDIPATKWGDDVLKFYVAGAINQHSIGFSTIKREVFNDDNWDARYTVIKEVKLYEGSAVLWGANIFTPTLAVGKSFKDLTKEESVTAFENELKEIESITKLFKSGHLSDQAFELLDIKIGQSKERLLQLYKGATQPVVNTVEAGQTEKYLDVFKQFIQN